MDVMKTWQGYRVDLVRTWYKECTKYAEGNIKVDFFQVRTEEDDLRKSFISTEDNIWGLLLCLFLSQQLNCVQGCVGRTHTLHQLSIIKCMIKTCKLRFSAFKLGINKHKVHVHRREKHYLKPFLEKEKA